MQNNLSIQVICVAMIGGRYLISLGNTVYILCASLIHGTEVDLIEDDSEHKIVELILNNLSGIVNEKI